MIPKPYNAQIQRLEQFLRSIVNDLIASKGFDPDRLTEGNSNFRSKAKKRFHFQDENDWPLLCTCLDNLGDTEKALQEFFSPQRMNSGSFNQKFTLLELFGVLSAVYTQQRSIRALSVIVKCTDIKSFEDCEILFLRHVLTAHHTDFTDRASSGISEKHYFRVDRPGLGIDWNITIRDDQNNGKDYNLLETFKIYQAIAIANLYSVIVKSVKLWYETESGKLSDLLIELRNLSATVG